MIIAAGCSLHHRAMRQRCLLFYFYVRSNDVTLKPLMAESRLFTTNEKIEHKCHKPRFLIILAGGGELARTVLASELHDKHDGETCQSSDWNSIVAELLMSVSSTHTHTHTHTHTFARVLRRLVI